jgi:cation transport regulator ChaB
MPHTKRKDLPKPLRKSPKKARRTYQKALDSAIAEYGDEARAHRTAYGALKHGFEKVDNRWEPKKRKGPSDERSRRPRGRGGQSAGGVDVEGHSKQELYKRATRLGVEGRSQMNKMELAKAIARKQR